MSDTPIDVILSWPTPNYQNPETRNTIGLWLTSGIFLFLASVCVGTRLWARVFVRGWFGIDDFFILLAFLCTVAVTALVTVAESQFGWNRHIWDVNPQVFEISGKILYALRILWALSSCFIRFSVLCLYYRLLSAVPAPHYYDWILHLVTVFNISLFILYVLGSAVPCIPVRAYWTFPPMTTAKCFNDTTAMETSAIINTFAEFVVAIVPLFAVIRLRVDKPWAAGGLLSLGFIVAIVGCIRTYYIFKAYRSYDPSWWSAAQWICSEVENNLAIMCACALPLRPVVGRMVDLRTSNSTLEVQQSFRPSAESSGTEGESEHNHSHRRANAAEVAEWTNAVQNIVDLEGIANDGLGYTVTITGPDKPRPKPRKWFKVARTNLLRPRETSPIAQLRTTRILTIPLKTEVTVSESLCSLSGTERGPRCGLPRIEPSDDMYDESAINEMFPQFLEESSMMAPELGTVPATQRIPESNTQASIQNLPGTPRKAESAAEFRPS